jgi:DNA-binding transcriptional ArsR family regulator
VKAAPSRLDSVFAALADPTRRAIVTRLASGPASVSELAAPFDVSLPAISKHVKILETIGLIVRERLGRVHELRLVVEPIREAERWLESHGGFRPRPLPRFSSAARESAPASSRRRVKPSAERSRTPRH